MTDQQATPAMLAYAKDYLRIGWPNEPVTLTLEDVARFAEQVRAGCHQDLIRLLKQCVSDTPEPAGKASLLALADALQESGLTLWGMPDCDCDEARCVYCGPRIAKRVLEATND